MEHIAQFEQLGLHVTHLGDGFRCWDAEEYKHIVRRQKYKEQVRKRDRLKEKRGRLVKRACENCGTTKRLEFHHTLYQQPRKREVLCRSCHKKADNVG